jgi:hypothetical protein
MMRYSEDSIVTRLDAKRNSNWRLIDYSEGLNQTDILLAVTHPSTSLFTQKPNYTNLDDIEDLTYLATEVAEEEDIPDLTHLLEDDEENIDYAFDLEAGVDEATANTYANDPFANPEARAKQFPGAVEVTADVLAGLDTDIELDVMGDDEVYEAPKEPTQILYFDDLQMMNDQHTMGEYVSNYLSQIQPEHRTILKGWANDILNNDELLIGFGLYVGNQEDVQRKALYVAVLEAEEHEGKIKVVRGYKEQEDSKVTSLPEYRGRRMSNMPAVEDTLTGTSA